MTRPTTVAKPLCLLALLLAAGLGWAQENPAQQQEVKARPILHTQGPAGIVRAIAFSGDSQRLIAAGVDKATYVWDVGGPGGPNRITPIHTLRWEIARANRGSINTLAVNPRHQEIAIAGASARANGGDVILFDAGVRLLKTSLPKVDREVGTGRPGHLLNVTQVDFSPDGSRLVSIARDGEVLLWRPRDGRRIDWTVSTVRPVQGEPKHSQRVRFVDNNTVVVGERVDPSSDEAWRVAVYSVLAANERLGVLPAVHRGSVVDIAVAPDSDLWATCDETGSVYLWRGVEQQEPTTLRRGGPVARRLAFAPGGLLAIGFDRSESPRPGPSRIELWDLAQRRMIDSTPLSLVENCHALAISPDGSMLATQDVATDEMLLFRLGAPGQPPRPRPLSGAEPERFSSRGRTIRTVAFGPRYQIAFGNGKQGVVDTAFDPGRGDFVPLKPAEQWRLAGVRGGGWQVLPASESRDPSTVRLNNNRQPYTIPLHPSLQGNQISETLIPGVDGRPAAVAIGTDISAGIFVYRLPAGPQEEPVLLRYFRDHSDGVTSLAVSQDGRYLVSGSIDQTIKVWSLEGLFDPPGQFKKRAAWGATFGMGDVGVTVTNVAVGGIAYGRGIRDGDVITSIATRGAVESEIVSSDRPSDILRILNQSPAYYQFLLGAQRGGKPLPLPLIVPAWEPVLTLFVSERGEWAAWHPSGYFDSSLAEGGDLFGWQENRGRDQPPRVVKGAFVQRDLERPDVIRRLLGAGSLEAALAQTPNRRPPTNASKSIQLLPEIDILSPRTGKRLSAKIGDELVARVLFPQGAKRDRFDVLASLGGRRLGDPSGVEQDGDAFTYRWDMTSHDKLNRFEVIATERGKAALDALNSSKVVFARGDDPPLDGPYKLHFFALACEAYRGKSGGFERLMYTIDDVDAIVGLLKSRERKGGFYRLAPEPVILRDHQVTRARVEQEIRELGKRLSPLGKKDIVIVYLHGHGKAIGKDYYFVPTDVATNREVARKAIPWSTFAKITKQRCQVVWMIDTCESGVAVRTIDDQIAKDRDIKAVMSEAKQSLSLAISAVNNDSETFEAPEWVQYPGREGGTPFADATLRGFDGQADGYLMKRSKIDGRPITRIVGNAEKDRIVSLAELAYYITKTVSDDTEARNRPRVAPQALLQAAADTKLVRVASP